MTAEAARRTMVERHLRARGIADTRVLAAMGSVQREAFLPEDLAAVAYDDRPLPIAGGQTISQPYIVALTAQALRLQGHEHVLEVGAGSGYAAAILGHLARSVVTIERIESLATTAAARLSSLGYANVHVHHADGSLGWAPDAPYEAIAVAAGAPRPPRALLEQLAIGGRLVIPFGPHDRQRLARITRTGATTWTEENLGEVRFVPLVGAHGWPASA